MKLDPITYARWALQAYSSQPDVGDPTSSARALLRTTGDGLAMIMPGTNNAACFLADLDAEAELTILGLVHEGFNHAAVSLVEYARAAKPAVLAGHSEGADLALLIAGYLCFAGLAPAAVYAYEPARCCADDKLRTMLADHNVTVWACRNGQDVIPIVPRLLHDWRVPADLVQIGTALRGYPNLFDHEMERVLAAVEAAYTGVTS